MRRRKMPDWMMDYVGAIGEDSYRDYRNLSEKYHNEIANYHENIYPQQNNHYREYNKMKGKDLGNLDPNDELERIDTRYKEEALDLACDKYGYQKPNPNVAKQDEKLTKLQENSPVFSKYIKESDKNISTDDYIAKAAHKDYFKKNPEAEKNFTSQKEFFKDIEEQEIQDYETPIPSNRNKEEVTPREPEKVEQPRSDIEPSLDDD